MGPRPVLTKDEALDLGVSSADLIVLARVLAIRDSSGRNPRIREVPLPEYWHRSCLYLQVEDVLKGDAGDDPASPMIWADHERASEVVNKLKPTSGLGVFFIENHALDWEFSPDRGLIPVSRRTRDLVASRIRSIADSQEPEKLAQVADLVIEGELGGVCKSLRAGARCLLVDVRRTLGPEQTAPQIAVQVLVPRALSYRRAIFFLRCESQGYSVVGANAGIIPTEDGHGKPLRPDAARMTEMIARVRATRQ